MLILDAAMAAQVQGTTAPGAALAPQPIDNSASFMLPERVLVDPDHAIRLAVLQSATKIAVDWSEVKVYDPDGKPTAKVGTIQEYDIKGQPTSSGSAQPSQADAKVG